MKKLIAIFSLATALSANAFFNNNDGPWGNNGPWGGGWNDDNGIFGYNSYDYWDPRWYFEEFENMMDEFDDNGWGNNNYYGPYAYGPYNQAPWAQNVAPVAPAAPVVAQ